jgi:hypothetical protein
MASKQLDIKIQFIFNLKHSIKSILFKDYARLRD